VAFIKPISAVNAEPARPANNNAATTGESSLTKVKALVFAFLISWTAVYQGYTCVPTSQGISAATTRTVVYSSLAILGFDFILTALMFGGTV